MATPTYQPGVVGTIKATDDLVNFRFVGYDGAHCGAGKKATGVTERNYDDGEVAGVVKTGTVIVEVGGTISEAGVPLASDADGKAVEANTPEGTTQITGDDLVAINGYSAGDPDDYPITSGYVLVDLKG
ncbi:MAG: hypothetical protein ABRQ38_02035 [Candidatus Eremiobacterota bacterium]